MWFIYFFHPRAHASRWPIAKYGSRRRRAASTSWRSCLQRCLTVSHWSEHYVLQLRTTTLGSCVSCCELISGIVRFLLRAGVNMNNTLKTAAQHDSADAMRALIKAKAGVDRDNSIWPAVDVAARRSATVRCLLHHAPALATVVTRLDLLGRQCVFPRGQHAPGHCTSCPSRRRYCSARGSDIQTVKM